LAALTSVVLGFVLMTPVQVLAGGLRQAADVLARSYRRGVGAITT
jgi:hypothetical protein